MGSPGVQTSWRAFLRGGAAERKKFEERHPRMRWIRITTIFVPLLLTTAGGFAAAVTEPPTNYGVGLTLLIVSASIMVGSLFVYGIARWKEDRRVGEVAMGIGFIPVLVLAIVVGICIRDLVMGVRASGYCEASLVFLWFSLAHILIWIFAGWIVDYHLYRGLPGEGT